MRSQTRHCNVHGSYTDYGGDGCPECQSLHEGIVQGIAIVASELVRTQSDVARAQVEAADARSRMARAVTDPGDFTCPLCKYRTLRQGATRCPSCQGEITAAHWSEIEEECRVKRLEAQEQRRRVAWIQAEEEKKLRRIYDEEAQSQAAAADLRRRNEEIREQKSAASSRRSVRVAIRVVIGIAIAAIFLGILLSWNFVNASRTAPAPSDLSPIPASASAGEAFATGTASNRSTPVFPAIAVTDTRTGPNVVAPAGYVLGRPVFTLEPRQRAEIVAVFDNDSESRYTCQVRTSGQRVGYVLCRDLELSDWRGEKGELIRMLWSFSYEYEENLGAAWRDIDQLQNFARKYKKGQFAAFAEIEALTRLTTLAQFDGQEATRARRELSSTFSKIRSTGRLPLTQAKVEVRWPVEARKLNWFDANSGNFELESIMSIFNFLKSLASQMPSPISKPTPS